MEKRLVYLGSLPHPAAAELLSRQNEVKVVHLKNDQTEAEIWQGFATAHAYHVRAARDELPKPYHVQEAFLDRAPELLIASSTGAGYDPIDVEACTARGIAVVNQAGGNKEAVAEHALGMILMLAKRIGEADHALRRGQVTSREALMGHNIQGKTLGIVGIGNVGARLAELAGGLFDMQVLAYDPLLSEDEIRARGGRPVPFQELLTQSDYVSVHCPRTKDSAGMFDAEAFGRMKQGAYFITTARGGIHDEAALLDALKAGHVAGAGLDVWDYEPPGPDHPLLQLDTVIASPHTAGVTHESRRDISLFGVEQLIGMFAGERPPRLVNPEVWPEYRRRFHKAFGVEPQS